MRLDIRKFQVSRIKRHVIGGATAAWMVFGMCAGPASAHVMLDKPVGGEMLVAGSVFSIMWHDTAEHGPADYDLWYSTTGPNGPWIEIAANLPPGDREGVQSYDWTVSDLESSQVRFRVRQDNQEFDYDDVSQADSKILVAADPVTVDLDADRDATLYEESSSIANGSGDFIFSGFTAPQNSGAERRALISFDIAGSVPAGSTITSVSLELRLSRTSSGNQTVELRRVTESWSEGSSNPSGSEGDGDGGDAVAGDTTWVHRTVPDSTWATEGGSFPATVSASQQVGGTGPYTWSSTAQMVADVQGWLDDPSSNHGWLLLLPSAGMGSAKRFNSRENGSGQPQLSITYEAVVSAPTAGFGFEPANPKVGETVTFADSSTGSPTAWSWDFGDGGSSDEQNPTHMFTTAGNYTVGLTASNESGEDTATASVTVIEDEPELTEVVLVPGVANLTGANSSFFVTTLDVLNRGSVTATFRMLWLPRDLDNSDPEESALSMLEPGEVVRFENVLADVFGVDEMAGAVVVISDSQDLEVLGRTFNQTEIGTFGQSSPGIAEQDLIPAGTRALVMFMTENSDFRSNLGVASGVGIPITVMWELFDADGNSLGTGDEDLPPWGNIQLNRVFRVFRPVRAAYLHVWTDTSGGAFTCFGSVLDNDTSDPTTVTPR